MVIKLKLNAWCKSKIFAYNTTEKNNLVMKDKM